MTDKIAELQNPENQNCYTCRHAEFTGGYECPFLCQYFGGFAVSHEESYKKCKYWLYKKPEALNVALEQFKRRYKDV